MGHDGNTAKMTVEDVARHFIRMEVSKPDMQSQRAEILEWCRKPDREFIQWFKEFAKNRPGQNPFFDYSVCAKSDRCLDVDFWTKQSVACKDLFSCGISCEMKGI